MYPLGTIGENATRLVINHIIKRGKKNRWFYQDENAQEHTEGIKDVWERERSYWNKHFKTLTILKRAACRWKRAIGDIYYDVENKNYSDQ